MILTGEHEELRASIRQFLKREITPELVQEIDEQDAVPDWLVTRMVELG